MTTLEKLETEVLKVIEHKTLEENTAVQLIMNAAEAYANQVSEERVRDAYRQGIDDALYDPRTMTPEAIAARNTRLASLNKPQETRPQTNGDLVGGQK